MTGSLTLHNVVTALPPDVTDWLEKTDVRGSGDIDASLKGKYIAATGEMPDLLLDLKIRNGYVANGRPPVPIKNLYLDLHSRLPGDAKAMPPKDIMTSFSTRGAHGS